MLNSSTLAAAAALFTSCMFYSLENAPPKSENDHGMDHGARARYAALLTAFTRPVFCFFTTGPGGKPRARETLTRQRPPI